MAIRKYVHTFTIAANTDWQAVRAYSLGIDGHILAISYRLKPAGATNGAVTMRLHDTADSLPLTTGEIAALKEPGIFLEDVTSLVASATAATDVNVVGTVSTAAAWLSSRVGSDQQPLLTIRGDGVLAGDVVVVIRAYDTDK